MSEDHEEVARGFLFRDGNGVVKITFSSWYEKEWIEARETIQTLNARLNLTLALMVPMIIGVFFDILKGGI